MIDVDPAWLEELADDEKAPSTAPRNTIPVQSSWLIPPLPDEVKKPSKVPKPTRPPAKPSRPPVTITTKPKGKLPPPLPRTDDDGDDGK